MSLNEDEKEAVERILEIIVPYSIPINDRVLKMVTGGVFKWDKKRIVEVLVNHVSHDSLASLKLRTIYTILKQCYEGVNVGENY